MFVAFELPVKMLITAFIFKCYTLSWHDFKNIFKDPSAVCPGRTKCKNLTESVAVYCVWYPRICKYSLDFRCKYKSVFIMCIKQRFYSKSVAEQNESVMVFI